MSIEAMKLALALNAWTHFGECRATDGPIPTPAEVDAALRTAIEQAEQAQPVAWLCKRKDGLFDVLSDQTCVKCFPVYTAPPPRLPWVGLTDEEICPWFQENTALTNEAAMRITRAIELKLKAKNA